MSIKEKSDALLLAHKEIAFQETERNKRAAELLIANNELIFQNREKENRATELVLANKELKHQKHEKKKRAAELLIANDELIFQNKEKENRAAELVIANHELNYQNREKEKRAAELLLINTELTKTEAALKEYIVGLEEMIFMISHKVRHPIGNISGIINLLEGFANSPEDLKAMIAYLKQSATTLDDFTQELTAFMEDLRESAKIQ